MAIPDNDQTGVSISVPVTGVGGASNLKFSVDGATCSATEGSTTVGIDHTFVGDLVGTLTSPSGKSVTLFSRTGGTGANICQAVFDDSAARSFSSAQPSEAPFTGSWKPATGTQWRLSLSNLLHRDEVNQRRLVDDAGNDDRLTETLRTGTSVRLTFETAL